MKHFTMASVKGILCFVILISAPSFSTANPDQSDFGEDANFASQDEHQSLRGNGDDQFFGVGRDLNMVHYANDDPEASGDDDELIPVQPKKPVLPKSRPKLEPDNEPDAHTEVAEVTVDHASFKPVEFSFKHPVFSGEQSTVQPEANPEKSVTMVEPQPQVDEEENELDEEKKETAHEKKEETPLLKSDKIPEAEKELNEDDEETHGDLVDNGHEYNETGLTHGKATKRTHSSGLSNIAKIGIAMGCIVVFWLLICPIVCIVFRRRDKKRGKRAEEYKLKNGVPHHQHHLVEELVLTDLGQNEKHQSNGKQKLYGNDALSAEEIQRLSNESNVSNNSNHSDVATKRPFPETAPLASAEAMDTEV